MSRKPRNFGFVIEEADGNVRAILLVNGKRLLDFENECAPSVRVRCGRPDSERLLELARLRSSDDPRFTEPVDWLEFYIHSLHGEAAELVLEVRKTLRRLEAVARCSTRAERAKARLEADNGSPD